MDYRIGVYQKNHKKVEDLNKNHIGVSFEMNWTGDLTDEEFHHSQGVNSSLAEQASHEDNDNDRRLL